jgi:hypothetical protein
MESNDEEKHPISKQDRKKMRDYFEYHRFIYACLTLRV